MLGSIVLPRLSFGFEMLYTSHGVASIQSGQNSASPVSCTWFSPHRYRAADFVPPASSDWQAYIDSCVQREYQCCLILSVELAY